VQTPETSESGYLGGMPLRLLVGYRPELIAARLGLTPVPERRIVLAGARDLDPPRSSGGYGHRLHLVSGSGRQAYRPVPGSAAQHLTEPRPLPDASLFSVGAQPPQGGRPIRSVGLQRGAGRIEAAHRDPAQLPGRPADR
jgi:hypothetical protein